ncbi:MAG: CvpA family protein [Bacteroidales bacterium]|nr:CvpA family protein [Bacteroidales bacterium]
MPYFENNYLLLHYGTASQTFQSANIIILRIYMNIIDVIILICLVPAVFQGYRKGFISQAISIVSLVVGIWASARFADMVTAWIAQYITASEPVLKLVAFALILILVFLALGLIGRLLESILNFAFLGWVNRLLGIVFSLLKTLLIIGLVIILFNSLNSNIGLVKPETLADSALYQPIKNLADVVFPFIKNLLTLK